MKSIFAQWNRVAGYLLIAGALAWMFKLVVIVSTNGRIINTGPAAVLMTAGLILLFIGSTGIGFSLARTRGMVIRAVSILLSPALLFGAFIFMGMISEPLFRDSVFWYAPEEAPIGLAVLLSLAVGLRLSRSREQMVKSRT